jgi:DNA transformation protein and related proteins
VAADPEWIAELFEIYGPVRLKRMFSGFGVYDGDFCIALAINPGLCLRVDDGNRSEMASIGAAPFTYAKQGKEITVQKWWRLPDAVIDDPDAVARLARLSLDVARRLPPKKPKKPGVRKVAGSSAGKAKKRPGKAILA